MNNVINWFEIPVQDMVRATGFYQHMLGVTLIAEQIAETTMAVFPYVEPVISGALVKGDNFTPSHNCVVIYLATMDINAALDRAVTAGGKCCLAPLTLPEDIGTIALIIDSEGNRVGLHQQV